MVQKAVMNQLAVHESELSVNLEGESLLVPTNCLDNVMLLMNIGISVKKTMEP
jgi:hypothetical protein